MDDQRGQERESRHPFDSCAKGAIIGYNGERGSIKIVPLFCHKWNCPRCGKQKQKLWRSYALAGEPQRFITLTARPQEGKSKREMCKEMKHAFAQLVQKYRRKYGEFEYLCAWELTKQGTPHVHILQRGSFIPQADLSKDWCNRTGSFIVDVRKVKSQEQVARYVTKYLTKTLGETSEVLSGLRIVQKSKNWILDKHKEIFDKETNNASPIQEWYFCFANPKEILEYAIKVYHLELNGNISPEQATLTGKCSAETAGAIANAFYL